MTHIVDHRSYGRHKSAINRQRFICRYKKQIKAVVEAAINKRSITDIEKGETVIIPAQDTKEPTIAHGKGGQRQLIYAGNKEFVKGDKIPRPRLNSSQDNGSVSNSGIGLDDFTFELSKEEFLDMFFEDLALPDLIKKQLSIIPMYKSVRAGYTISGTPSNLNVIRTFKGAFSRKIAISSSYKKQLHKVEEEVDHFQMEYNQNNPKLKEAQEKIVHLRKKIATIPFIDIFDLRYNNRIQQNLPTTQAVMFCIMDVSGSMDKVKKDIAKRFFILLYLFLKRNYDKIEIVFIRHHTFAKEVSEEEFFYSRETGGTVVSSAIRLMKDVIDNRYSHNIWNIYVAQASDGDNWNADSPYCSKLLLEDVMSHLQYYAYVEIMPRLHQSLWEAYLKVKEQHTNFAMQAINEPTEIYPVFRHLFKKRRP